MISFSNKQGNHSITFDAYKQGETKLFGVFCAYDMKEAFLSFNFCLIGFTLLIEVQ